MKKAAKKSAQHSLMPEQLAPVLRPKKIKKLARGKSFVSGNCIGAETRFREGVSGNPGGRPRSAQDAEALRQLLTMDTTEDIPVRTNAERLANEVFKLATAGKKKLGAICEIGDRAEGRPAVALGGGSDADPIAQLVIEMRQVGARLYGKPEGMPQRNQAAISEQKEQENEETES